MLNKRRSHKRDVPPAVRHRTEQMLAKLKEHYDRGAEANRLALKLGSDARWFTRTFAEERGIGYTTVAKERLFASRYSREQFKELCRLRRNSADPDVKLPFHWGFVPYLLTAPDGKRRALQREAAKQGWTAPELYEVIKQRFPETRRQATGHLGGRNRKAFRTLNAGLAAISLDGDRLRRRCADVLNKFGPKTGSKASRVLRRIIDELDASVDQLSNLT